MLDEKRDGGFKFFCDASILCGLSEELHTEKVCIYAGG
jgi:hypothetical protein